MSQKAKILVAVVVVIGLGCGVVALSRARAQQVSTSTKSDYANDHTENSPGADDTQENKHEQSGHHEGDEDEHGHGDAQLHDEHDDHAGHDEHDAEPVVQLSREERSKFGVVVATAGTGQLTTHIRLPGELVLNVDRVAHIVPRAPGIVREVLASVGDTVHTGEVMAWIESAELGEAKVHYLAKWAALGSSSVDLDRALEVHHNTARLLEVLNTSPSLETLRKTDVGVMGENRSILVSAYAEFVFTKAAFLREGPLFEKKIASERDYQVAEAEYKKADALFGAARDSTEFKIRRDLLQAERMQQVREIELQGAKRHLYILGLTSEEIQELERLAELHMRVSTRNAKCDDPQCNICQQAASINEGVAIETTPHNADEKLAWYPLRAPFDGRVIEKHLTLGERISDDSGAFTVADLSSVWVDIAVYQKDLAYVKKGMNVSITAGVGLPDTNGVIAYMAPVVDEKTRTALARVVLLNPDGRLRPGLFVNAEISIGQESASVVIPKSAVQRMGEKPVVFLDTSEGFKPAPVTLGRYNESSVEILSGLIAGQRYVTNGAFELKAKIVTSGLGAHAGHGH